MTAGRVTRMFRQMRMTEESIKNNSDLWWFGLSVFGAFLLGVFTMSLTFALFMWGGVAPENLQAGVKTAIATAIALLTEIVAIIKKIYAPPGEISKSLQASGNKDLKTLDNRGYSVVSTELRSMHDVLFSEEKISPSESRENESSNP